MYRTGSVPNSDAKLITPRKVNWSNDYVNTLGISLSSNVAAGKNNVLDIIDEMRVGSKTGYYRSMSLSGKIVIINSLMSFLFAYKFQVLPVLSDNSVKMIDDVIVDFLWHGKRAKIPLAILQLAKQGGGLGLVNIKAKYKALLCNYIANTKSYPEIKNLASYHLGPQVNSSLIWKLNLNQADSVQCFPGNSFCYTLLHMWHGYNFHEPKNATTLTEQIIWYNSLIYAQGKPYKIKHGKEIYK